MKRSFPLPPLAIVASSLSLLLASCATTTVDVRPPIGDGTRAEMALLETTDLHTNVLSYDYFRLSEDKTIGFERVATLITDARKQFANTLLFDNGDTIQGTALSDYQAQVKPLACDQVLAMYKVMNALQYDAGGIGNHEFNYGLSFLSQVTGNRFNVDLAASEKPMPAQPCAGPNFPLVLANVLSVKDRQPLFKPYVILDRTIKAVGNDGKPVNATLKVGVIAFTPPKILDWDKRWLNGVVYTDGIKEMAEKYVPEMRAKGADLVIAISHGGLDAGQYTPSMENANWHLALVPGIDAMLIGHSHQQFPNAASTIPQFNLPGVDKAKGFVNGMPTVMANFWGKTLGVIQMSLVTKDGKWSVDRSKTVVEARSIQNADKSFVEPLPAVAATIEAEHQATIQYVKTPIGSSDFAMTSYFVDVGDTSSIQIVNQAQTDYVANYVKANLPQFASLPVLSTASPFKTGFAGGADFTDIAAGNIAINNAADLYLFPNTLYAVKVTGAGLKDWLEAAARRFRQIDPALTIEQSLTSTAPGYTFDMITSRDFSYEIDVTQGNGKRIKNLIYQGAPVSPSAEFIVATNNYRASGGGNFPGLDGTKTIIASPDTNRDVLIQYIKTTKALTRKDHGSDQSWRFSKVTTAGPVTFKSAANKLPLAAAAGIDNVSLFKADDGSGKGLSVYQVDLSK
ncbi:MAG: bifunctional 2',3'-cyclic-nucleotide 2'-phosphodiesterase/3'-nucleotidase [Rhizobacter sp.]|nr:bifunctional 2',3'-cyclic-nucleotide 2'-phosphodiesterase/3'-nucleotidase [Burkholderiales bacterium]